MGNVARLVCKLVHRLCREDSSRLGPNFRGQMRSRWDHEFAGWISIFFLRPVYGEARRIVFSATLAFGRADEEQIHYFFS